MFERGSHLDSLAEVDVEEAGASLLDPQQRQADKRSIQHLLLDGDGTVTDSYDFLVGVEGQVLEEAKVSVPEGVYEAALGITFPEFLEMLKREHGAVLDVQKLIRSHAERVHAGYTNSVELMPGFEAFIGDAVARKLGMAVVTNNTGVLLRRALARHSLMRHIGEVIGIDNEGSKPKPDPWMLRRAMRGIGAQPDTTMMIGDSLADKRAAINAGVRFFAGIVHPNNHRLAGEFEFHEGNTFGAPAFNFAELMARIDRINNPN